MTINLDAITLSLEPGETRRVSRDEQNITVTNTRDVARTFSEREVRELFQSNERTVAI